MIENEYKFAVSNFQKTKDSNMYKFKYIHKWCLEYSKFLIDEVHYKRNVKTDSTLRKKYKKYKKGTIIYAKLGINIGNEFSGNHFCMVLNKKDTIFNPIITVVPLTSSDTKHNILINENILQVATAILHKQAKVIADELISHARRLYQTGDEVSQELIDISNNLEGKSNDLFKVYDRYQRYEKHNTYANVLNITTISKDRITKINKYDPSGEMSYSEDIIQMVDEKIKNRFLNI